MDKLYAIRDKTTGKLISTLTNPKRKFWERKGNAQAAIDRCRTYPYNRYPEQLEVVTYRLIEEVN